MDEQRPPVPEPEDEPEGEDTASTIDAGDGATEIPPADQPTDAGDEASENPPEDQPTVPIDPSQLEDDIPADAQATQPIVYPVQSAAPPAEEPATGAAGDSERLALLRRLTPTELAVLRLRCDGATSAQISATLSVSAAAAAAHLGNIYDKLGITYAAEGTSLTRLMEFCPLLDAPGAPAVPAVAGVAAMSTSPVGQPSQRAAQLAAADDAALLAQMSGTPPPPGDQGGRSGWIIGGVLAFALIIGLIAFFIFADDDDDDGDATPTTAGQATEVVSTATVAAEPTPAEPTATLAPEEPTATPEPPTATPEPPPTEVPPTETPEPTATPEPPTATPEPEPTATVAVTPVPAEGQLAYQADWSGGANDWQLSEGWVAAEGALVADGTVAGPLLSPYVPPQADYAVEAELVLTNVDACATVAGVFARVTQQSNIADQFLAGYIGDACAEGWRIEAVNQNNPNRDTLASGPFALNDQPHVYRLEVSGEQLRLFIDGVFVGEADDDRWDETGGAGIYLDGPLQLRVNAFRVYTLPPPG